MQKPRTGPRRRTLKAGTISFDHAAGIDCVVRNISKTGACLEVESPIGIPSDFTLIIRTDQLMRLCQVVWRRRQRIGVRFG